MIIQCISVYGPWQNIGIRTIFDGPIKSFFYVKGIGIRVDFVMSNYLKIVFFFFIIKFLFLLIAVPVDCKKNWINLLGRIGTTTVGKH